MPRQAKPARLWLRQRAGREAVWVILHRGQERATGCVESDHEGATRALQEYLAESYAPDFGDGDPRRVSISDTLTLYGSERAPKTRKPKLEASNIDRLGEFFDGKMLADITPSVCEAYVEWRKKQKNAKYRKNPDEAPNVGTATARRELDTLSAAIGYAYAEKKVLYLVPVKLPPTASPRSRYLTRSEFARLLWAAWRLGGRPAWHDEAKRLRERGWTLKQIAGRLGKSSTGTIAYALRDDTAPRWTGRHLARWLLIAFYTGTRKRAILSLQWMPNTTGGWIDFRHMLIHRKAELETETDKRRPPVAISQRLAAHLRRWAPKNGGPGYVVEFMGQPVDDIKNAFEAARVAAGLDDKVIPHTMRHSFASLAILEGATFAEVAETIGTSEQIVRKTYGHLSKQYTRPTVEKVARGRARFGT